jgi:hypothetical protein
VRFPYLALRTRGPVYSLGGIRVRHKPVVPIHIVGPQMLPPTDSCIDSAADDTVFPAHMARRLRIDLTSAPSGEAMAVGLTPVAIRYARVKLLLADGFETAQWEVVVGFTAAPLRWPLLGQAGFLEFFDVELKGLRHEVSVKPNASFPGQHVVHRRAPP